MPTRGHRKPKLPLGDLDDPTCLGAFVKRYLKWMRVRQYSPRTVENHEVYLRFLVEWAHSADVTKPEQVTRAVLESYQEYLYDFEKPDGSSLSANAQHCRLVPVRGFFRWMVRKEHLPANPASDLYLPRLGRQLPKNIMNAKDA